MTLVELQAVAAEWRKVWTAIVPDGNGQAARDEADLKLEAAIREARLMHPEDAIEEFQAWTANDAENGQDHVIVVFESGLRLDIPTEF